MLYSIPASLTTNEVSIQGEGALTARDISVVEKSFPSWNDLNVSAVPTIHNIVPPKDVAFDKEYTLHQPISPAASAKPKAAIGLIDVETGTSDPWIRIYSRIDTVTESNIDLKVGSWGKTQLFRGTSPLFWATPQSSEPNPIFQTGVLNVKAQAINQWVKFDIPYKTQPKVFVDISGIDLGGRHSRPRYYIVSTNRDGFYVNTTSPEKLQSVDINWIAWPENQPGVETGTFYAGPVKGNSTVKGDIELDTVHDSQPKVHFALSSLSLVVKTNFAFRLDATVSKTTLSWSAGTWLPQGLNRVRGNYLMFKVWKKDDSSQSLRTASLLMYGYRSVQETREGGVVTNFPILTVCFFSFHSFFPFSFFASRYRLAPTNP